MESARFDALEARLSAFEERLYAMEEEKGSAAMAHPPVYTRLLAAYPSGMLKSSAAKELGVTRATVYAMLADGRLELTNMNRVSAESVARLLTVTPPGAARYHK